MLYQKPVKQKKMTRQEAQDIKNKQSSDILAKVSFPKPIKECKIKVYELKKIRKKKPKKSERQVLIKECDDLWSDCVIARDKKCLYSGDDTFLSAHHIRTRGHWATRWLLENGITLSWRKVHFLQKMNPEKFNDMVIEVIGQEYYDHMKFKSSIVVDYSVEDLRDIKELLKNKLKELS
jgi:hypothetical protein